MKFSEKDVLTDLLLGTKSISNSYHHGVLESANNQVRNTFIQLNNDMLNFQKQIFDIMHDKGYYQVEPARTAQTAQTAQATPAYRSGMQSQMGMQSEFESRQRPY